MKDLINNIFMYFTSCVDDVFHNVGGLQRFCTYKYQHQVLRKEYWQSVRVHCICMGRWGFLWKTYQLFCKIIKIYKIVESSIICLLFFKVDNFWHDSWYKLKFVLHNKYFFLSNVTVHTCKRGLINKENLFFVAKLRWLKIVPHISLLSY